MLTESLGGQRENGPREGAASQPTGPTGAVPIGHLDATKTAHRRQASVWKRRPWMDCGRHTDTCRCHYTPTRQQLDGYTDAIDHLQAHGLRPAALMPECRALWSCGGDERAAAARVVRWWSA